MRAEFLECGDPATAGPLSKRGRVRALPKQESSALIRACRAVAREGWVIPWPVVYPSICVVIPSRTRRQGTSQMRTRLTQTTYSVT
ncbi:MAG: hypothetical protein DME61_09265 [Verrucomicrobia bacterium]|nr:MAG: hypothetical protein DME61_09265 [Verrucomicrobiota bacterium]PYL69551.1 MAG: hypothetical protein DMF28_02900 [Verrucomicrobiota bacterium]